MKTWLDSFLACRSLLLRRVARFVGPHDIEDIVQETFVRSYVASRKQVIRNPRAFMLRTAKNLALNNLNRADSRLNDSMENLVEEQLAHAETPEQHCQSQEQFLVFCQAVAELPARCRRAFILKKVYGLSYREISLDLGITEATAKKHIVKGMAWTAKYMAERGYEIESHDDPLPKQSMEEAQES
jgi:RNA polymerase sigma factor (sigma-70 family)